MRLKTQEDIRKLEILSVLLTGTLAKGNIPITDIVNEENMELLYMITQGIFTVDALSSFQIQRVTEEHKKLSNLYDQVLDNTISLMEDLDIDNVVEIFATYVYMYRNGYLSNNHEFKYDIHMKDFSKLLGVDVIRGTGVCRSISSFLTDLYNKKGYDASTLFVKASKESCNNQQKLCDTKLEKTENGGSFASIVGSITKIISFPNHMITTVSDVSKSYILDPTNDGMLYKDSNHRIKISNERYGTMISYDMISKIYQLFGFNVINKNTDLKKDRYDGLKFKEVYKDTQEVLHYNRDVLQEFYKENKELYEEITSISNENSGLLKRMIPIIPKAKVKKL